MKLTLHNHQKKARLRLKAVRRLTQWLAAQAETRAPAPWGDVALVLTDDAGIAPVNRHAFGKDGATDVITFVFDPLPGEPRNTHGEIHVNVERAAHVARVNHELALYIAHGFNHLSGARDHTPRERQRMRRRELAWLRQAAVLGLLDGLHANGAS